MHIDKDFPYKRRIRIKGKPDKPHGRYLFITDMETGQPITNILRITMRLSAREPNEADLTYAEEDESGKIIIGSDGGPIENTITVENPEIDVSALETERSGDSETS